MNALIIFAAFATGIYGHPGTSIAHRVEGEGDMAASVLTVTPPPGTQEPFEVRGATPHEALQRARALMRAAYDQAEAQAREAFEAEQARGREAFGAEQTRAREAFDAPRAEARARVAVTEETLAAIPV